MIYNWSTQMVGRCPMTPAEVKAGLIDEATGIEPPEFKHVIAYDDERKVLTRVQRGPDGRMMMDATGEAVATITEQRACRVVLKREANA